MENEIYLWGSGGGASEIRHLIEDLNQRGAGYVIKGIVGRGPRATRADLDNLPYIDTARDDWAAEIVPSATAVVTAGQPDLRETMWTEIRKLRLEAPPLIHPSAVISETAFVSAGCVIGPNVTISVKATLGENTYVSFNASIGHDSCVGAHSVISPGARLGGEVECGSRFFIGLGGIVTPRVKIGDNVSVSAGALVVRSIPSEGKAISLRSRVIG